MDTYLGKYMYVYMDPYIGSTSSLVVKYAESWKLDSWV